MTAKRVYLNQWQAIALAYAVAPSSGLSELERHSEYCRVLGLRLDPKQKYQFVVLPLVSINRLILHMRNGKNP